MLKADSRLQQVHYPLRRARPTGMLKLQVDASFFLLTTFDDLRSAFVTKSGTAPHPARGRWADTAPHIPSNKDIVAFCGGLCKLEIRAPKPPGKEQMQVDTHVSTLWYPSKGAVMRARIIVRWGYSMDVRLPKVFILVVGLQEGDTLVFGARNGTIVAKPFKKKPSLKELLAKITPDNIHEEVNWGKPRGREVW